MLNMKMKFLAIMLMGISTVGCATDDYMRYAETQREMQIARSNAEVERYKAMAAIAANGDSTTKVAAMFALQGDGGNGNNGNHAAHIAPPKSPWEIAREWAGIVLPVAVQAYGINANKEIAVTQSNNSRDVAISTNGTFATMGGHIATGGASTASVANAGFTALTNVSQSGFTNMNNMGTTISNVATAGFTSNQNIAQSGLTATQTVATSGLTAVQSTATAGITGVQNTATAGLTAVQGTATSGITAVQNTATAGITGVQTTATGAITALDTP